VLLTAHEERSFAGVELAHKNGLGNRLPRPVVAERAMTTALSTFMGAAYSKVNT